MDRDHVLTIDIGSTHTRIALVDTKRMACAARRDVPTGALSGSMAEVLDALETHVRDSRAVIAGGRSGIAQEVAAALQKRGCPEITHLAFHEQLPLAFRYERPETLGADRIADALYACAAWPDRTVIIIDSGTAITIDLVTKKREFAGGIIMAGIPAQLQCLHTRTTALPLLGLPHEAPSFPAASTIDCMLAGTIHGIAGSLNHFVHAYRNMAGDSCLVAATGGGWPLTAPFVDFEFTAVPDMTLLGCALYTEPPEPVVP
ncbi:MAG: type III pantothenate kinase [Chitinispirillaceae bacterium]|nr:type III pantothenate kinase [Chitinispirillaceae bacterium]